MDEDQGLSYRLSQELSRGGKIYIVTSGSAFLTTEERLKLFLQEHKDALDARNAAIAYLAMFLTSIGLLLNPTEFKTTLFGITSDSWQYAFVVSAILSASFAVSSFRTIVSRIWKYKSAFVFSIEFMIDKLKEESDELTHKEQDSPTHHSDSDLSTPDPSPPNSPYHDPYKDLLRNERFPTGQICRYSGIYHSLCHPDKEVAISSGETFPPCLGDNQGPHLADWSYIQFP